jgi:hypothetical protein
MASNFTTTPHQVIPEIPEYNTLVTQSEGMKKQFQSLSVTPIQRFRLIFKNLTNSVAMGIQNHYVSCYGGWDSFSWTTVPTYIDTDMTGTGDGTAMTGRWVEGSLKMTPLAATRWDVELTFEKSI